MKRQAWLDYMKFIAMFMVVVYHTPPRYDTAREVALFNMGAPVFFFAAGYLFNIAKQKNFFTFLRHRARQILVHGRFWYPIPLFSSFFMPCGLP